jgi:hypothetical protein
VISTYAVNAYPESQDTVYTKLNTLQGKHEEIIRVYKKGEVMLMDLSASTQPEIDQFLNRKVRGHIQGVKSVEVYTETTS